VDSLLAFWAKARKTELRLQWEPMEFSFS